MKRSKKIVSKTIDISADAAWEVVGAVTGVEQWFGAIITSCRVEGGKRICGTAEGEFEEDIINVDHDNMIFEYGIEKQHLLPVENILGKMVISPLSQGRSEINWTWTFDVDASNETEVLQAFEGMGTMGIQGIEEFALKQAA